MVYKWKRCPFSKHWGLHFQHRIWGMPWRPPLMLIGIVWLIPQTLCCKVFPPEPGEAIFNQTIWIPLHMHKGRK